MCDTIHEIWYDIFILPENGLALVGECEGGVVRLAAVHEHVSNHESRLDIVVVIGTTCGVDGVAVAGVVYSYIRIA